MLKLRVLPTPFAFMGILHPGTIPPHWVHVHTTTRAIICLCNYLHLHTLNDTHPGPFHRRTSVDAGRDSDADQKLSRFFQRNGGGVVMSGTVT